LKVENAVAVGANRIRPATPATRLQEKSKVKNAETPFLTFDFLIFTS
jgi:hypothetical protein